MFSQTFTAICTIIFICCRGLIALRDDMVFGPSLIVVHTSFMLISFTVFYFTNLHRFQCRSISCTMLCSTYCSTLNLIHLFFNSPQVRHVISFFPSFSSHRFFFVRGNCHRHCQYCIIQVGK